MKEELVFPFLGAISTALIAALVSLVVAILTKDQKTSEFRQAWIDGLRDDVSRFVGAAEALFAAVEIVEGKEGGDTDEFFLSKYSELAEAEFLLSKIRLRLNPVEHVELIEIIKWLRDENQPGDRRHVSRKVEKLVVGIQSVLKDEWERVKAGERSYRILKYVSWAVVGSIFTTAAGYLLITLVFKVAM